MENLYKNNGYICTHIYIYNAHTFTFIRIAICIHHGYMYTYTPTLNLRIPQLTFVRTSTLTIPIISSSQIRRTGSLENHSASRTGIHPDCLLRSSLKTEIALEREDGPVVRVYLLVGYHGEPKVNLFHNIKNI